MSVNRCAWMVSLCIISLVFMASQLGCPQGEPPSSPPGTGPAAEPATEPAEEAEAEAAAEPEAKPVAKAEAAADLPKVPLGLPPVPVPGDNPITPEKVALGKMLYFDTRLSKDGTISCATCHDPEMAWAEHKPTNTGIGDQVGGANSPTVINAAYAKTQFWDGRAASLEEQALGPIENPIEMGHELPAMIADLSKVSDYGPAFEKAFGDPKITSDRVAKAIASFERLVLSGNSPYDKFQDGQEDALTDAQKRGMELFGEVGCNRCHRPPLFSNYMFHNAGIGMDKDPPDQGRKAVTGEDGNLGEFRVPALREVANTAPYFHDGSSATLEEAVALMVAGGKDNENLSLMLKAVREKEITEQDQKDLVEFLKALSGEFPGKDDL
ncbi:MAG TPA: cytochrome c peroxidase [Thermoguttaceae bacterium]|nr:cytochrome c peroxidase [Thermoguttaceae bacterium]